MPLARYLAPLLSILAMTHGATAHGAEAYPSKPIRFIVAYSPGGGSDVLARLLGEQLTGVWHQQIIIDNRPGAGANLGAEIAAKAAPDGYTLFQSTVAHTVAPSLYKDLRYDIDRDFVAVTEIASTPFVLVVKDSLPAKSISELVALAKSKPGALTYASSGVGGPSHLGMELFKYATGAEIQHIPYKGAGQYMTAISGGEVDMTYSGIAPVVTLVKAGRLRALGIGSMKRTPLMPSVPTLDEGGAKGFEGGTWYGVQAPAGTPRPIVTTVNREVVRVLNKPDFSGRLAAEGFDVVASTQEEFTAFVRSELTKWASVVKKAGIPAQ